MPRFQCTACGASFAVPQATIDKYPGWEPQYCRKDSPGKRKCGPRLKTPRSALGSVRGSTRTEENLPLARVLAKYDGGPASGVFTDGSAVPNPGPGGWGVVWVENGEIQEQRHGHHPDTTPRSALGSVRGSTRTEENLPLARVLAKYDGGPASGVFTDGSAVPNPGPGGWGVVWVENGEIQEQRHGHHPDTTNNRMELTALIEAFKLLPEDATARVLTDSELCVNTITKWAPAWERRGWKRKGNNPIKNLELVQELLPLFRAHAACELSWIAAHSGNRWNEYADSLATAWMRSEL